MSSIPQERAAITGAQVKTRKKLIEVALPLEAINKACVKEGSPFTPRHPRSLAVWWARRRLAAARAVIFSQMVDDPSAYVDTLRADPKLQRKAASTLKARLNLWQEARSLAEKAGSFGLAVAEPGPAPTLDDVLADQERQRLFRIIEELVLWENTTNETVLQTARDEIWSSWRRTCLDNVDHPRAKELFDRHKLPAFHDPFSGGGALPLEAQRLGLESYASELNPVAVLINKAMIEIPSRFARRPPVNPEARQENTLIGREWNGVQGLAEDVRYYGQWMRDEAEKRIGHLYPKVEVTAEMARERPDLKKYMGKSLTVNAWVWARTVKSPNPAFSQVEVPLASTFMLSTKAGKEAYVEPIIENGGYRFTVKVGKPKDAEGAKNGTKLARANFVCLMSGSPITGAYIKAEGKAGRMGVRLMAIVAEGERGRVYLAPTPGPMEVAARETRPDWVPDIDLVGKCRDQLPLYGLDTFADIFTARQLVALTTFSDLVQEARQQVKQDALAASVADDGKPMRDHGIGATAYSEAVGVYFGLAIARWTDLFSSLSAWNSTNQNIKNLFSRQAVPMVWDYAESNPFGSGASFISTIGTFLRLFASLPASPAGHSSQLDAAVQSWSSDKVVSTDPPYYDNVCYADLSDFFYVWLRRSQRLVFPDLFATLAVPKAEELIASPYRHESEEKAEKFFLYGMTQAMHRLAEQAHPAFPVTIYYAFKQSETEGESGTTSTGWETFLEAMVRSGFSIVGTWPMKTERTEALKKNVNALASSIILVCRPRAADARTATRGEFVTALKAELPVALANLQRGSIAPVDLQMAAIGPGMAIYTRYSGVFDAAGKNLSVGQALTLIFQTLDEALAEQEGDFDSDSRWAITWFEEQGFAEGEYGIAEQLSKSKNTSVAGMVEAGIVKSSRGKVRLLTPAELDAAWDPATDQRRPAWQAVHQLVQAADRGETALAELILKLGPEAERARELAYRLYVLCDRKKRSEEAGWYNGLVQSWPEAIRLARTVGVAAPEQQQLFGTE